MDFGRVEIVKLAQAYGLIYSECLELAKSFDIDCYAMVSGCYIFLDKLDTFAEMWAKNNISSLNIPAWLAKNIALVAVTISPELNDRYELNDIEYLREFSRSVLLGLMSVPKKDAVLFLHENGFYLKTEVKGIAREFVERVIGHENGNKLSASAAAVTSGSGNSPEAEAIIPRILWKSREAQTIVSNMRAAKMPEDAIAYALKHGCAKSNTDIGRAMYPDLSDRGWRGRAKKLLDKPTKTWKLE